MPKKLILYRSNLEIEDINERLNSITEKFYTNSSNEYKFEGKIKEFNFAILPTFDYSARDQIRPEILGKLTKKENDTEVSLKFRIPSEIKTLLILALIINVTVITLMISLPDLVDSPFWDMWGIFLILIPLMFVVFQTLYISKVSTAEKILIDLLELKKPPFS